MDRFNFFGRSNDVRPAIAVAVVDDDTIPLSPRPAPEQIHDQGVDVEAQRRQSGTTQSSNNRASRLISRFRPVIPSWFSATSSASRDPASTNASPQIGGPRPSSRRWDGDEPETPKSPPFRIHEQSLPSTRLHLPNLTRTWTQGSNGLPSRPGTRQEMLSLSQARGQNGADDGEDIIVVEVTEPRPAVEAVHVQTYGVGEGRQPFSREDNDGDGEESEETRSYGGSRSRLSSADLAELRLAELAQDGRRRRYRPRRDGEHSDRSHRSHRSRGTRDQGVSAENRGRRRPRREERCEGEQGRQGSDEQEEGSGRRGQRPATPKHFLFCFPWIKSRRMRNQILQCFVSGMFLTSLLVIYLALSLTKNINNDEFTVLLILIILCATVIFCHGLIRLCMLVIKGSRAHRDNELFHRGSLRWTSGPGGYAIPPRPIRVVIGGDEEAGGMEITKVTPPPYGLWRGSVRVDPNQIQWVCSEDMPSTLIEEAETLEETHTGSRAGARRPPSYASEDGVSYVLNAQPRSMAPTTDVPLTHHADAERGAHILSNR